MIYCEPKPDEVLLGELAGSREVFLLGCSLCANISYCIHNGLQSPIYRGLDAVNVKREIKRLKEVLARQGVHCGSATLVSLCLVTTEQQAKVIRKTTGAETVVTLSCEFGRRNTQDYLKDKRVACAMKNKGLMRATVNQKRLTLRLDRDRLYINNKRYAGKNTADRADQ
jgi:hypothetical protein